MKGSIAFYERHLSYPREIWVMPRTPHWRDGGLPHTNEVKLCLQGTMGSMITAELANGYNKDVFALPVKITDAKRAGCNLLIKNNKAMLLTDAQEIIDVMGWEEKKNRKNEKKNQRELFIELTPDEKVVVEILQQQDRLHIDELYLRSGLSSSAAAQALLMLEMQGVILSLPGKIYKLS